ncbi:hypothetical protein KFE94_01735 [bacterium SCSIO 12643]|nr:hypothetical protein KFE94_01735 [bacterium SCSIO 12643]
MKVYSKCTECKEEIAFSTYLFVYPLLYKTNNPYGIYVTSGSLLFPGVVYALLKKQDSDRVSKFNRHNLKGRVHNIGR